ncbi:MAG TPA: amidohydrolase family protein [Azospirillaceae bacterium]|nr:amidohydrolase family protein [Azospirillaceae bacterium]
MRQFASAAPWLLSAALLAGCASTDGGKGEAVKGGGDPASVRLAAKGLDPAASSESFPSTYRPMPSVTTAIVGARLLTGTGEEIEDGTIVLEGGRITAVGRGVPVPAGATVIEARGKWVTPGLIDAHSHLGVYASPSVAAHSDGNEMTDPNTANVWAEHSVWPQDPGFTRALAGGVTSLQVLPGSANLFGGRTVVLKNVPARTMQDMKFPGAPQGLKMACGENPKRLYGGKGRSPATRMGNVAGYRKAWIDAADYQRKWDEWRKKYAAATDDKKPDPPKRDLALDTLAGVLRGEILVQNHCYRADEMAMMLDVAREFGYRITMFHHASEAYKIADVLAREDICVATWAEWWGFKMEAFDGIEENPALVHAKGGCTVIHSDDETIIQRLNQEAATAMAAGNRLGLNITRADAIKWVTANPAKAIGVLDKTGTLEAGKMADVVLWSADPFSVYAVAEKVFIDGAVAYDRADRRFQPQTDFELGQPGKESRR